MSFVFTLQPLHANGKLLMPIGRPFTAASDAGMLRRALVEVLGERNMYVHRRSKELRGCVSAEKPPYEVVCSEGKMLLAVWRGDRTGGEM